jgi:hypothetical protein
MTPPIKMLDEDDAAADRSVVDWEAVERDYRIGQLTVRQIAEKRGCSTSGMMSRAKREGWTRDLSEAVKIETKAKVRAKVVADIKEKSEQASEQTSEQRTKTEQEVTAFEIEVAATVSANIILSHQRRSGRLAALLDKMTGELEQIADCPQALDEIAAAINESDPGAAEAIKKLRSVTTRFNNLKTAAEILVRLNTEERRAFALDDDAQAGKSSSIEDMIRRIKDEETTT